MNPDIANLIVVAYLIFGTIGIAVITGWAMNHIGTSNQVCRFHSPERACQLLLALSGGE